MAEVNDEGSEAGPPKRGRTFRSPEVTVQANDKWDWLYKVGVKKVMEQKQAGRKQEDIIFEREKDEYTFQPNKNPQKTVTSANREKKPANPTSNAKGPSKPAGTSNFIC